MPDLFGCILVKREELAISTLKTGKPVVN